MLYIRIAAFFDKVFTSTLRGRFDFSTLVLDRPSPTRHTIEKVGQSTQRDFFAGLSKGCVPADGCYERIPTSYRYL
jgi:hypothetical protein